MHVQYSIQFNTQVLEQGSLRVKTRLFFDCLDPQLHLRF